MNEEKTVFGDGSELDPYTSPDGTAGIQAALNALRHGGALELESARYNIEKTVTLDESSRAIVGKIWSCNTDPNGVFEAKTGTKIRMNGRDYPAIRIGESTDPISGARVRELGVQGDIPGMDTRPLVDFERPEASAGLAIDKVRCDQCHFQDLSFCGVANAVCLSGNAMSDACVFDSINTDGCGNGFWVTPRVSVYSHIRNCVVADTPYYGVYVNGSGKRIHNLAIYNTHFVRNAGAFVDGDGKIAASVLLTDVDRCEVRDCLFDSPGTFWHYPEGATHNKEKDEIIKRASVALYIKGNGHRIRGNTFYNSSDDSIRIIGNGNILMSNICDSNVRISGRDNYVSSIAFTRPDARLILEGEACGTTVIFGVEESRIVRI